MVLHAFFAVVLTAFIVCIIADAVNGGKYIAMVWGWLVEAVKWVGNLLQTLSDKYLSQNRYVPS